MWGFESFIVEYSSENGLKSHLINQNHGRSEPILWFDLQYITSETLKNCSAQWYNISKEQWNMQKYANELINYS